MVIAAPAPVDDSSTPAASEKSQKSREKQQPFSAKDLQGFKYFRGLDALFDRLHDDATERDRAGNRHFFFDNYASLLLLGYFNPIVTTLRGVQHASTLDKVQQQLGCPRVSLGSLSEASHIFDPELLGGIFKELVHNPAVQAQMAKPELKALGELTAVDGTLLRALPRMAWALWQDEQHRALKMHLHFDVVHGIPREVSFTAANDSEITELQNTLQAGRLYVLDRGYGCFQLLGDIIKADSSFVVRVRENTRFTVREERTLTAADRAVGVTRDVVVEQLGSACYQGILTKPVRLIFVEKPNPKDPEQPLLMLLCTDRLDLPAELVVAAYRYRWQIELFFRWFKHILGCRHLFSDSENGIAIQLYVALIASLLVALWVGKKPTKRTLEILQFYFLGWATQEEVAAHIHKLSEPKKKNKQ